MKTTNRIKILLTAFILLILNINLQSQVVVERSKEKVIISGKPYFIHFVKKGETAYSISRAYGMKVEDLTKENPPAIYGVKEGESLRIPVSMVTDSIPAILPQIPVKHDDVRFIYHILKPGETIYFLSKTYDVSENEILKSNPGIDINKLSVGMEIAVPKKEFMPPRQNFNDHDKEFFYHKVLAGETLSSIADKYGLTVREVRKVNRDMKFPQVGDFVRIPGAQTPEKTVSQPVIRDTVTPVTEEPVKPVNRPLGYTPVRELSGTFNMAVLLPFYLKENTIRAELDSSKSAKGKKIYKSTRRSDSWIFPQSVDFIEMYQGILLAADTLRSLGMDINIYTFDIDNDTVELTKLIKDRKLEGMDLIIGPVYSHNLSLVAAYAKGLGIPVVSPVPLYSNSSLINNPDLFLATSTQEIVQKALAEKISEFPGSNIIFIHADTSGTDGDIKRFRSQIFSELTKKIPYEEIKFKEFPFYSRSMFDNDSINRLSHAMSDQNKNIIIIASEDAPVISETIIDIHSLSKRFDLKVFGYPILRDLENLDPKYLFDLDVMVYYPTWIDHSERDVKQFNAGFRQKFLTEPTDKSYAWQGYDIAYYFISGLGLHGKEFLNHPEIHRPDLLESDYDFVRKSPADGFENQKLFLIRYTKDYEVKLVDENPMLIQR